MFKRSRVMTRPSRKALSLSWIASSLRTTRTLSLSFLLGTLISWGIRLWVRRFVAGLTFTFAPPQVFTGLTKETLPITNGRSESDSTSPLSMEVAFPPLFGKEWLKMLSPHSSSYVASTALGQELAGSLANERLILEP